MDLEWRQWRRRSLFLVTCGSVLAGTLLFWYLRHRRRWSLAQPNLTHSQGQSTKLRHYSLSHCTIDVIDSQGACEEILQSKTPQSLRVIGLDCEWVNRERGGSFPVALLQLAFLDGHCLLVRLCKINEIPSTLLEILQDNRIFKFGVAIENDAQKLQTGFGVQLAGCVDLRHIAVRCGLRQRGLGLRGLATRLLNVELDKSWRLRCSNWEAEQLSEQQVKYAASDAAIALDILKALLHIKMGHEKSVHQLSHPHSESDLESSLGTPSITKSNEPNVEQILPSGNPDPRTRKQSTFENSGKVDHMQEISDSLLGSEANLTLVTLCQGVVDVVYKQPRNTRGSGLQSGGVQQPKRQLHSCCVRKTPLYDNCRLLAPDGSLLSVVDYKKIQWYLDRHLGTLVSETPPTLQLTFEPAGKPGKDREYYLVQKENICVVCGCNEDCIRKSIVPQEYRKLFPAEMKDHISHDILLMCISCHQRATMYGDQLKRQLAEEYQAPLSATNNAKFKKDPKLVQVKNFARALLRPSIPESRRQELLAGLAEYWECMPDDLTANMIEDASQVDTRLCNVSYCPHAEVVVKRIRETEGVTGLIAFQTRWRQHFLDSMKPRFLPDLWSVNHNPH